MADYINNYPALTEMGIARAGEISSYILRMEGKTTDVLKIYYQRTKGSFLPQSRKYKFGRAPKTVRTDSGTGATELVHEISPFLNKAVAELDALLNTQRSATKEKDLLLAEVIELEQIMQDRLDEIRARIKRLT